MCEGGCARQRSILLFGSCWACTCKKVLCTGFAGSVNRVSVSDFTCQCTAYTPSQLLSYP